MRRVMVVLLLQAAASLAWASGPTEHWVEVRTPHFVVLTDSSDKQARHVGSQLEGMRSVFHILVPAASDAAGAPIVVFALRDKKSFQALEPPAYLAKGQVDLAGYFLQTPDINYIFLRLDAEGDHPFATVYHEYTHYMMRGASSWAPLWLNEGLAEFYQNTVIQDKEVLLGEPSQDDLLYLRQNQLIPLTTLLTIDQNSPYYHQEQKASIFYSESWALTHMIEITDKQKGTDRLTTYARLLVQKKDSLTAAQEAFGDLKQLQQSLNAYISQFQFMAFKMKTGVQIDEANFQPVVITNSDADAIRADVLADNGRRTEAKALLDATLRDDPKNAQAHETMGSLEFRDGNREEAKKWYGEAVQLNSESYLANYYFAVLSLTQGAGTQDPAVEASLRNCIRLNPTFAPAYDSLAMYLSREPDKSEEAHMLSLQAVSLEPTSLIYRLNAAAVLVNVHQYNDALSVLKAASKLAKSQDEAEMLHSRMAEIQQYQDDMARNEKAQADAAAGVETTTGPVEDTRTFTVQNSDGRTYVTKADSSQAGPKHPTEEPTGKHHTAMGVLRNVQCSYPSVLTLNVNLSGKGTPVALYRNDFYKIDFSVLNFTPKGNINPCTDIEGLKGKVEYAEVSDKTVAGQILSIELSK